MRRAEQEKKKSQKVDFVSGGTQPVTIAPASRINIPIPGLKKILFVNLVGYAFRSYLFPFKIKLGNAVLILSPSVGVSTAAATGLPSAPPVADTATRDARQNKKSKWDKVLIKAYAIYNCQIILADSPYLSVYSFCFRWMGIEEILCPLGGRIPFLQLGLMLYFYLPLMLVLDTWLLRKFC